MHMRPSRVLNVLRNGGVVASVKLNLSDPRGFELAAMCGFDCAWTDFEHVPNSWHDLEGQIRAAKLHDVDVVVRVERGSYSDLVRPLEADAAGIIVPHVMSADDAREVAWRSRFHPVGRRPMDGGNADGAYCLIPVDEYLATANRERFVIVQIEDPEPLEELDEIAAVDGIDMLFFGPGDFSQGIGVPGKMDDPRIDDARRQVAEAARRHGKFAATTGSIQTLPALIEQGYTFVNLAADVIALSTAYRQTVSDFRQIAGRTSS